MCCSPSVSWQTVLREEDITYVTRLPGLVNSWCLSGLPKKEGERGIACVSMWLRALLVMLSNSSHALIYHHVCSIL